MTGAYIVSVAGVITIPVPIPEVTLTLAEVEVLVQEAYNKGYSKGHTDGTRAQQAWGWSR